MNVDVLHADANLVVMPSIYHVGVLDVYEETTAIYLGCLLHAYPKPDLKILRLPLKETLHYGATFEGEDRFAEFGQSGKYIDFRLEWLFFNHGRQKKITAWTTHENWQELIRDRQLKPF